MTTDEKIAGGSTLTEKTSRCNALLLIGLLAPSQLFRYQLLAKQR